MGVDEMERRDLKLSGATTFTGGEYKDIRISGACKITSDVTCESIHVSGASKIDGNVKADECKVSGSCKITGGIQAGEMKISGGAAVEEDVVAKSASFSGGTRVGGFVKADSLKVSGELKVGRDIECEDFFLSGSCEAGTVNVERCEMKLGGPTRFNELVGASIKVYQGSGSGRFSLKSFFSGGNAQGTLKVQVIEGDDIHLENTTCERVSGNNVEIGPGCRIKTVEYGTKLTVHDSSVVEHRLER